MTEILEHFDIILENLYVSKDEKYAIAKDQDSNQFMLLNKNCELLISGPKGFCFEWYRVSILKDKNND